MIGIAVALTGHLRPGLYTHSVLASPPDFPTAFLYFVYSFVVVVVVVVV